MPAASDRSGHIDNSIVLWIVLIVLVIAIPAFVENATGWTVGAWWRSLPDTSTSLVIRSALLGGVVLVATLVSALVFSGRPLRRLKRDQAVLIPLSEPVGRTFGLGLCLLGGYLVVAGLGVSGALRWAAVVLGAASALLGIAILAAGERLLVDSGQVVRQRRFFGRVVSTAERRLDATAPEPATLTTTTTGGAFGQPLTTHFSVRVAGGEVHTGTSENRARAVLEAINGAVREAPSTARRPSRPPR